MKRRASIKAMLDICRTFSRDKEGFPSGSCMVGGRERALRELVVQGHVLVKKLWLAGFKLAVVPATVITTTDSGMKTVATGKVDERGRPDIDVVQLGGGSDLHLSSILNMSCVMRSRVMS